MDPNSIRFSRRTKSIGELLSLTPVGPLSVSSRHEMTQLVELALVNGPLPTVIMIDNWGDSTVEFGAGEKLVAALAIFASGVPLGETSFVPEWSGKALNELPLWIQRRFRRRDVDVVVVEPGKTPDVAAHLLQTMSLGLQGSV